MKKLEEYIEERLHIGKIPIPESLECRHFLIIGKSGSGKTQLIYSFLDRLRKRDDIKVVIYDFKGDFISFFYTENDLIFNPLDIRSIHWCPLSEVKMLSDIDSLATSLIPPTTRDDKFWVDGARDVFASLAYIVFTRFGADNFQLFYHTSLNENDTLACVSQAMMEGLDFVRRALGYLEQGTQKGAKVAGDVLATMRQYTNCFYYLKHLSNTFTIEDFLHKKTGWLFLVGFPKLRDTLKPLFSLFIDTLIKTVLSLEDDINRRIFLILDEFATLQRLPTIIQGLEQGRSKGLSLVIALQDINQLRRIYWEETSNSIINNCSNIVAFSLNDVVSCDYMSRLFGEYEIIETDESLSMGPSDLRDGLMIQRKRKIERLLLPSEFALLKDLQCFVKISSYLTKTNINVSRRVKQSEPLVINSCFLLDTKYKEG